MTKKYPKITVVTPSFNQGEFLERTILSIINQDYPNLEYIVCDGGSTDQSVSIIKKYEKYITWWCSEKDKGQTDAINKGFKRATGDVVGWINSDDVLLPGALWTVADFYANHPDTDFANGFTIEIDGNDKIIKFMHTVFNKFLARHGGYNVSQLGMFWRRDIFGKIGYLDDSFHAMMDVEWLARVYDSGVKVRRINSNLGAIRIHEGTKTALRGEIWSRDSKELIRKYSNRYRRNRKSMFYKFFRFCKVVDGCFFRDVIMTMKYKGKPVAEYSENLKHCLRKG